MGVITYYPKGSTSTQTFGIATYVPTLKNMMWIVGHGQGECGDGSQAALSNVIHWGDSYDGGWVDMKAAADTYGIVLVFVNTALTSKYASGEYTFALNFGLATFPTIPEAKCWIVGHSLGWYGAGRSFFNSLTLAKRVAGTIVSASGPYGDTAGASTWPNLVSAGCKVWGVTATNDTASGTDPKWVRYLYDKLKAINSGAHTIVSEFPTGTWTSATAHNAVLTKLTRDPIEVTASITRGIPTGLPILMNVYEWALSNPRGANYQAPTSAYVGAIYPDPVSTTPVSIKNTNWDIERKIGLITWSDNQTLSIKAATGDKIVNVYTRKDSKGNILMDVDFALAVTKTYGPYR